MTDTSGAEDRLRLLVKALGKDRAREELDRLLDSCSVVELAGNLYDWDMWAREKQKAPTTNWQTWGFLCGRMFGKTYAISQHINREVAAGRAMLIGLAAQDEDNAIKLQVTGPSGLIATAPPWFKPEWHVSELTLVWPNGARAFVRTPEVPGKIRGFDYHLAWLSELQSWPNATREEAWSNFQFAIRLGYARMIWDSTPKRRHPILKRLLRDHEENPSRFCVVRGSSDENRMNVGDGVIERLEREYGGTQKGREELLGEMLEDSESALVRMEWIDKARRPLEKLTRTVIAVDPAITSRQGSDETGIIVAGLTVDGQVAVLSDCTGKHSPEEWAKIVLDLYEKGADLLLVETNKGGQLLVTNLRAAARDRGVSVVVIGKEDRCPGRQPKTIFVREVYGRGSKEDRATPLATAYERGRVSHVLGASLGALEDTLTTWEPVPGAKSPDRLDPLVYAVIELLGLSVNESTGSGGFVGVGALAEAVKSSPRRSNIATLLGGNSGGGRI